MSVRLLHAKDRLPTPWRNGRGTTREIAAWPPGATWEQFDWRVSMADVHEAGPFSNFPGVDRVLTIVQGTLALAIDGRPAVTLTAETPAFCFAGDAACIGEPLGGPVRDLNVMLRRARFSADVSRVSDTNLVVPGATYLLVALSPARAVLGASEWRMDAHDALLLRDEGGPAPWIVGPFVMINVEPR